MGNSFEEGSAYYIGPESINEIIFLFIYQFKN